MNAAGMGIDLTEIAELNTRIGTTGALGMSSLTDDPIFEFTIAIVVLVTGINGN